MGLWVVSIRLLRLYGLLPGRRLIRMLGANVRESNQFSVVGGGKERTVKGASVLDHGIEPIARRLGVRVRARARARVC